MKTLRLTLPLLLLALSLQAAAFSRAPICETRQGSIELGSGSTKAYAAIVDACAKKIASTLHSSQVAIPFNEALEKSPSLEIPTEMLEQTTAHLLELKKNLTEQKVASITGFATAAFRKARNAEAFLNELTRRTGVHFKVISQDDEARLGFLSASSALPPDSFTQPRNVIVWDIGGGSMQIQAAPEKNLPAFKSETASVTFKNRVLREVLKKDPSKIASPNPLRQNFAKATELARKTADAEVPATYRLEASQTRWVGVGGVLSRSVLEQTNPQGSSFTRTAVAAAGIKRSTLSDRQIGGSYAATDLTNMALVLGFMESLGITEIETVTSSLGPGWLLDTTKPK